MTRLAAVAPASLSDTLPVALLVLYAILDTVGVSGTSALASEGGERWTFAGSVVAVS